MHHEHHERRTYRLTTVEGWQPDSDPFIEYEDVRDVTRSGRQYEFTYTADEKEAAALLRRLIAQGIPVISFGVVKASLEDVYLRSGVKQVD